MVCFPASGFSHPLEESARTYTPELSRFFQRVEGSGHELTYREHSSYRLDAKARKPTIMAVNIGRTEPNLSSSDPETGALAAPATRQAATPRLQQAQTRRIPVAKRSESYSRNRSSQTAAAHTQANANGISHSATRSDEPAARTHDATPKRTLAKRPWQSAAEPLQSPLRSRGSIPITHCGNGGSATVERKHETDESDC